MGSGTEGYRFSAGPVDVLVLNSEDIDEPDFDRAQQQWLEQELRQLVASPDAGRRWRIVLTHQTHGMG